eukprot:scaffold28499_cov35-Tisochrysis_lutea.AAC.1
MSNLAKTCPTIPQIYPVSHFRQPNTNTHTTYWALRTVATSAPSNVPLALHQDKKKLNHAFSFS